MWVIQKRKHGLIPKNNSWPLYASKVFKPQSTFLGHKKSDCILIKCGNVKFRREESACLVWIRHCETERGERVRWGPGRHTGNSCYSGLDTNIALRPQHKTEATLNTHTGQRETWNVKASLFPVSSSQCRRQCVYSVQYCTVRGGRLSGRWPEQQSSTCLRPSDGR